MDADADISSADSVGSTTPAPLLLAPAALPEEERDGPPQTETGGGAGNAVLWLMVRIVLAGVQGFLALEWFLGKVFETLVWVVELGMLLVQPPLER